MAGAVRQAPLLGDADASIRRYTELVRAGAGNEADRFVILREHQERLTTQIAALTACLETVSFKVKL
jgi:hypothetical protein